MKKTLTKNEKIAYEYLIKTISSCINNAEPPKPYNDDINWESLLSITRHSGLQAMFADSVLRLSKFSNVEKNVTDKLNEVKNKEIFVDGILSFEIEKVLRTFEKYQIKNIPLKGYFLKNEYPRTDFRSLSDYDILFDEKDIDKVNKAFEELGYTFVVREDNQFHFQKKPYMYIEMHSTLVHDFEIYFPFVKDQLSNGIKRDNYDFSCNMKEEDFYLYMLIHNSNHYRLGGMGIRMVLDIYLFYKNHKDTFDFEYLEQRLKLYKLDLFEKKIREIAFRWFSGKNPQIEFDKIETYIILSNALGRSNVGVMINTEKSIQSAKKRGKNKSKLSYLISSIFPKRNKMKAKYKFLCKFPFLLPVSWFLMWYRRVFILKDVHYKQGITSRMSYTDADVRYFKAVLKHVGFNDID